MTRAVFVDTWAFRALADSADPNHSVAGSCDDQLLAAGIARVTSDYVLDEALTGLHVRAGSRVAIRFLDAVLALIQDRALRVERVTQPRFDVAAGLFRRLSTKLPRLSFTDCTSFAIMREVRIRWAFTADGHFDGAGRDLHALLARKQDGQVVARPFPFAA